MIDFADYHKKEQIVAQMQTELDRMQKTNVQVVSINSKLKEEKDHFKNQYHMLSLEVNHYKTELTKVRSKLCDVPAGNVNLEICLELTSLGTKCVTYIICALY